MIAGAVAAYRYVYPPTSIGLEIVGGIMFMAFVFWSSPKIDRRRLRALRGRCPECGYNLNGNVSGMCPECGLAR
jgi:hypothetical protein